MKLVISPADLRAALTVASSVVRPRSTLPVLECENCGKLLIRQQRRFCSKRCLGLKIAPHESLPLEDRFWAKVNKNGPISDSAPHLGACWLWTAASASDGRGTVHVGTSRRDRRMQTAPQVAWELLVSAIPDGLYALHHCDVPACVRADPDPLVSHLFLGTKTDNAQDRDTKNRQARGTRLPQAKLTDLTVIEIRGLYAGGRFDQQALADRYGVSQTNISQIVRRLTWTHVESMR